MGLENEIQTNLKKFLNSANLVFDSSDWTSATILYFKSMFAIIDIIILRETGKVPKDHEERFRILEEKFPDLYKILDNLFPIYRASYRYSIERDKCEKVRKNVRQLTERYKMS